MCKSSENQRDTLLAVGLQAATKIGRSGSVVDAVQRSPKGTYCLKCIQEHYGRFWTSIDNGTYYCATHRKQLWQQYLDSKPGVLTVAKPHDTILVSPK